ncbi:MAG: hypothetical protein GOMPHAMPRED_002529 [Gomphillus americanus]|uniref:Uncharacterized protein n=1 Tax=Gomphillus americanus TaxID=1940652 RepID=A0A8H3FEW0_9LECA|nr:MAG: hypothetical protein GOMPHAMPRED_002529 [Gomphillus americanus]
MDQGLQPGKVSLEILVHTSAQVTNAEDDMYRKQARALSKYLNDRARPIGGFDKRAMIPTLVKQTPLPDKLSKEHKINHNLGHFHNADFAVAESILVSASTGGSASSGLVKMSLLARKQVPMVYNQNLKSPTSSTASVLGEPMELPTTSIRHSKAVASFSQKQTNAGISCHGVDGTPYTTFSTASAIISPDSAGFILHSPAYIQTRKRKFFEAVEEPRKAQEATILSECSPNTGRKRQRSMAVLEKDSPTKIYDRDSTQVEPSQWLGSIARFSSSIAVNSTQNPLPTEPSPESTAPCRTYLSPWPKTGTEQYQTHKVGVFAYIASNTTLCNAYKPKSTKRPIEPLERGYWRLKIPFSWSTKAQDDFWSLLEDMIVQGKCGWGNWIEHVDASSTNNPNPACQKEKKLDLRQGSIAEIKIWCWGEVIREMWLAVLMASRRQTMRLGMAWYDSCGNVVVKMR